MVVRNKFYKIIDKYRELLKKRLSNRQRPGSMGCGNKTKNLILDFYIKNNRWPKRNSKNKKEHALAQRFENFISKEACSYDPQFRRIVMLTGRKSNSKRKHNVKGFKQEILEFIEKHGHIPARYDNEKIEGEGRLHAKLVYYTQKCNDMSFLGEVYDKDKCHRSGIPYKYRALINQSLDIEKPLFRLV